MLLTVLHLPGCDAAHGWDAVKIDTSKVDDAAGGVAAWHAGQREFASWTGRDQTRVRSVIFKDSICGGRCGGRYFAYNHSIRLLPDQPWSTSTHELCHSLDDEQGMPSHAHADVLEPYGEDLPRDLYSTYNARAGEVFARMCQQGPTQLQLVVTLNQACGVPGPVDAATIVGNIAFSGFGVALPTDRVTLRGLDPGLGQSVENQHGIEVRIAPEARAPIRRGEGGAR